jgi:hypothetical protein
MGVLPGPEKMNGTDRKKMLKETMDRGFTVFVSIVIEFRFSSLILQNSS